MAFNIMNWQSGCWTTRIEMILRERAKNSNANGCCQQILQPQVQTKQQERNVCVAPRVVWKRKGQWGKRRRRRTSASPGTRKQPPTSASTKETSAQYFPAVSFKQFVGGGTPKGGQLHFPSGLCLHQVTWGEPSAKTSACVPQGCVVQTCCASQVLGHSSHGG
jgi:hypothetical protein